MLEEGLQYAIVIRIICLLLKRIKVIKLFNKLKELTKKLKKITC